MEPRFDVSIWLFLLVGLVLAGAGLLLWLLLGREPKRRRAFKRCQRLLHEDHWADALKAVGEIRALAPLSPAWEGKAQNAEGECYRKAGETELAARRFEPSLEHFVTSARLLKLPEAEGRDRVLGTMLAEVRRLFAAGAGPPTAEARHLLDRIRTIQPDGPEAQFWQALCHVREGQVENAVAVLKAAQEGPGKAFVDIPLYLGVLLLRQGRAAEALRLFAEANRVEPNCPFVRWQLGVALVATGGDAGLATRALQAALGPRGLPAWVKAPERAWVEGFPDQAKSFVHRLAAQHKFECPVFGSDIAALVRQGFLALSQAQHRLGNYQEAANICDGLLKDAPPTQPVLRGLGLALARLERYDEAFKHLRAAYEMENPKDAVTAGYLALCGARGKPKKPEDKLNNVAWAVRLLSGFHEAVLGGAEPGAQATAGKPAGGSLLLEWAALCNGIFAEARAAQVAISPDDQRRAADVLAAVEAADATAAGVYDQLAVSRLDLVRPVHAWLYCRAAQAHGVRGQRDLEMFAVTFQHAAAAETFFSQHGWKIEEIEFTYLERWAEKHPASFPPTFPAEYPARAEQLLLDRSAAHEQAGQAEAALASAMLLFKLVPRSLPARDRLAQLHYRQGNPDAAAQLLAGWHRLAPADPKPLLRLAVLEQQRGNFAARTEAIERALQSAQGATRAAVAFLGARLALAEAAALGQLPGVGAAGGNGQPGASSHAADGEAPAAALRYLDECLRAQPGHPDALALLAAMRWQLGDRPRLAELAAAMSRPDVPNGRFQYLAAVAHRAANDIPGMLAAARRAATDPALAVESMYLVGLAHLQQKDWPAAQEALQPVGLAKDSPSADRARAILGCRSFTEGTYGDAAYWWQMLDASRRTAWKLDEPYRAGVYLAALQAYNQGRYEQAAEQFRLAGKLGWRDRNLGPLLSLALFKEGQRLFYNAENQWWKGGQAEQNGPPPVTLTDGWAKAAGFLEQSSKVGLKDPTGVYLLGLAEKRRGRIEEARTALRRISPPEAAVALQLGLLSLRDGQLAQAEQEFAQAWQLDPKAFAAGANLVLTRLALGRPADAVPTLPALVALAPNPQEWYLFTLLHALLRPGDGSRVVDPVLAQMTPDDEQRVLAVLRRLGHLETTSLMLGKLAAARLDSPGPRQTYFEVQILAAKRLLDRCDWTAAEKLLTGLAGQRDAPLPLQAAYFNLMGCASCLCQDFETGVGHFQTALRISGVDYAIHQNLAVAYEWQGQHGKAELHWNRFFDLLDRQRAAGTDQDFCTSLMFEGYLRLAALHSEKERWPQAAQNLEAALRTRPDNVATLERLFHMYHQMRKPDQARRLLQQLQQLRPGEPQFELYELDLIEINELDDLERWLAEIARILQRYAGNTTVEERGVFMIGNATQFMARVADQLTEQLNKVMKQVRSLDNYQVNWSAVQDVMRDLKREFQKLRRLVAKAHTMATNPEHRRVLRELAEHLDRKIDYCRRWQGE